MALQTGPLEESLAKGLFTNSVSRHHKEIVEKYIWKNNSKNLYLGLNLYLNLVAGRSVAFCRGVQPT